MPLRYISLSVESHKNVVGCRFTGNKKSFNGDNL